MNDAAQDVNNDFDSEALDATQGLIARLSSQMDEVGSQLKAHREMLKNIFENDDQMSQAKTVADEAKKTLKDRQSQLNESQEVKELKAKITDLNEDFKTIKDSLNNHLINYFQATGTTMVDMPGGEEREFTLTAKLKPSRN